MLSFKAAVTALSISFGMTVIAPAIAPQMMMAEAASTTVVAVVNGTPITSGDVAKRVNFLRLQRAKGNLNSLARQQLVDEAIERMGVLATQTSVSGDDVDAAYARFAANNKLSLEQLNTIMTKSGVTVDHFKSFIAISMSWPRAVQARFGDSNKLTAGDIGARIAKSGANRPKVNEYILKQVIFVVPENKRGITGKRKAEAEASRKKFPGCEQAKAFAATMRDVSVKDLGRFLEPELPDNWKELIKKAPAGGTTSTQVTPRGVEFIAICSKREVSDDAAAAAVFREEDLKKPGKQNEVDPNAKKYLEELRAKANVVLK
ncbi:peptidylprolyl isomerase [Rhizobium sp. C1]|uniref:peptidylprolyl isomerase n=1 Tax=Rhizobium sp. C1 TaxID=1349799 RepID=UPI001E5B805C|nr:peptidylprolyl isomerase [Rhizobium sp. C1]MCD2177656.1 peptidylprolyl isomerase [Rhizobium sp. C1]